MRVRCEHQLTLCLALQAVTVARWHRQTAFCVETEVSCALKHRVFLFVGQDFP